MLSRSHATNNRELTNFTLNLARLHQNEWMRIGVRLTLPEIDREISSIQERFGCSRDEAVKSYVDSITTEKPGVDGEVNARRVAALNGG